MAGSGSTARRWLGSALAGALLVATGCEEVTVVRVNAERAAAGEDALPVDRYLTEAARARAAALCDAGAVSPTPDPTSTYQGETAVAVAELVGAADLDPGVQPGHRNGLAGNELWSQWSDEPTLVDADWDELGVGEHECSDGRLTSAVLLRENPTMPATGLYSSLQHPDAAITVTSGVVYGQAVNHQGQTIDLLLDLYVPPPGPHAERPLIIWVHGGGFFRGSRTQWATNARDFARRGYVVASIDYRLRPNTHPPSSSRPPPTRSTT